MSPSLLLALLRSPSWKDGPLMPLSSAPKPAARTTPPAFPAVGRDTTRFRGTHRFRVSRGEDAEVEITLTEELLARPRVARLLRSLLAEVEGELREEAGPHLSLVG